MSGRRYSEEEAAAILSRAAELSTTTDRSKGVSIDELEKIAIEAGLDPAAIRRAAADVASLHKPVESSLMRTLFGPLAITFEAELEGELDERGREAVVEALSHSLDDAPQISGHGRVITAAVQRQGRNLQVVVSSSNGRTRILATERLGQMAGGIYGGVLGGVGGSLVPFVAIGGAALLGPVGAVAGSVVSLAACTLGTAALYKGIVNRRSARLKGAFDAVRGAAEEHVRPVEEASLADARARVGLADAPEASQQGQAVDVKQDQDAPRRVR